MSKPPNPIKELKNAFAAGLRILTAVEPLSEMQKMEEAHRAPRSKGTLRSTCEVCNGTLSVGQPGHEVNCPSCVVIECPQDMCLTCAGKGTVGATGHKIKCPVCKGTG